MKYHFMQKDSHLRGLLLLVVIAAATVSINAADIRTVKLIVNGEPVVIPLAEKPVITYTNNQLHITSATSASSTDVPVTQVGMFEFKGAPSRGDANGNNEIDANDVSEVVNYIVGKASDKFEKWGADFNGDKKVDVIDTSEIIKKITNNQ